MEAATKDLEHAMRVDSDLKSAVTAVGNLIAQVSASRSGITSDVSTAIPAETPVKTSWQTAAQVIGSNVLMFLLVSMVVGQLLDPIQRMLVSLDPSRGLTFPFLNKLYRADQPIGTVRFGDQRYRGTGSADGKRLRARDPHLLEPNYAIGRGLLTQAEYSSLQDQYYSQSQIATGLMLPSALLALVIYFRLLCCGIVKFGWGGVLVCTLLTLTLLSCLLAFVVYHFGKEGEDKRREVRELRAARIIGVGPLLFAIAVAVLVFVSYLLLGNWWLVGLAVGLPTLEVLCFIAGIDRLHNFYSNVQARIVGAAKKQEESQIKKFADILTDTKAKQSFIEELEKRRQEIANVLGPLTGGKS